MKIAILDNCRSDVSSVKNISWADLVKRMGQVEVGAKDGRAWMPADIDVGPRTGERVKSVSCLVLDVEAHTEKRGEEKVVVGPEPADADAIVAELGLWGWRSCLHTSYSHDAAHPRYRLIFDLSRPLQRAELKPLALHVAGMLGLSDCVDTSCMEPARLFYLPRCTADRTALFRHASVDGNPIDVEALLAEVKQIEQAQKSALAGRHTGKSGNVIDQFNQAHDIGMILEQHGYTPKGRGRWLWAGSTTGLAGVRLLPERGRQMIYSSHGGDPLHGNPQDAFDCWRILEHGGDIGRATREAARLLGLDRSQANASSAAMGTSASAPGNAAQDDMIDLHRNAPKPDDAMLYGLVGEVGRTAAETTEANRYAVAAGFLALLSAAVGRDAYLPVGNTKHHARLFTLHVGRTGRGRKGDALSLVHRIRLSIEEKHRDGGVLIDPFCGQCHSGGLSTREGLAVLIHDGYKTGKDEVPAILDKRLWVVESEFSNVLHQAKRDGNTLSGALRDAWDGQSIRPATKSARVWASDPHISLSAAITPSELLSLMESRELSNGFANRFLIFWAERERIIPFPKPTPASVVNDLVERTMQVIRFARGSYPDTQDSTGMILSEAAQDEYARLYRGELSAVQDGDKVTALLERRAPMLLRIAMLLALTDLVTTIEAHHIRAALAWVRYQAESVRFIFNLKTAVTRFHSHDLRGIGVFEMARFGRWSA
jgi:putative DNA primase/helicase